MFGRATSDLHYRSLRFELRPTASQKQRLLQMAGARRFAYNWGLDRWKRYYAEHGTSIRLSQLMRELTEFKRSSDGAWLYDVSSQIPQQALIDLRHAYRRFFRGQARYPTFRSRKRDRPRFRIAQHVRVRGNRVYVPRLGWIRMRLSRQVEGDTKSATFKRDARGRWHVSLVQPFAAPKPPRREAPSRIVGIDLGLSEFAVLSDGRRIAAQRFRRRAEKRLRRAQRSLSRKQPRSARWARGRGRLARAHQRVAHQRRDFLHKLTTDLIREYDVIAIEDLCVRGLARTNLSSSVLDAGWAEFRRQLEYKAAWNGRELVVVDRFFPSTRRCSRCGAMDGPSALSVRTWDCRCGARHDRELNAAINLRAEAERQLAVGRTDTLNARGAGIRLPMGADGEEAGTGVALDSGRQTGSILVRASSLPATGAAS